MGEWREIAGLTQYDEWCDRDRPYESEYEGSTHVYECGRRSETALPVELRLDLGLTDQQESELVTMNDEQKASFAEIAQQIREWFPHVFAPVGAQ